MESSNGKHQQLVERDLSPPKTQVNNYLYTHFETFASMGNGKLEYTLPNVAPTYQPLPPKPALPKEFCIEDLIEELLEATDMNPFITASALKQFISEQPSRLALESIFQSYIKASGEEEVCITTLA